MKSESTQRVGQASEQLAQRYLEQQGCQVIVANYQTKAGEIDLIAWDGNVLIFVEVRRRNNAHFGGAAASVTLAKQLKIRRTAQWFLKTGFLMGEHKEHSPICRFDVIALEGTRLDWIKAAF